MSPECLFKSFLRGLKGVPEQSYASLAGHRNEAHIFAKKRPNHLQDGFLGFCLFQGFLFCFLGFCLSVLAGVFVCLVGGGFFWFFFE